MTVKRIIIIFFFTIGLVFTVLMPSRVDGYGENDFLRYWSSSKILFSGGNPYDSESLYQIQFAIRPNFISQDEIVQAWNPPWLLLLFSPLTLLKFNYAARLWIFINIVITTLALYLLWKMMFESTDRKGLILILGAGFLFGNTMMMVYLGQISSLLLIGLVLCVWCLERELYFWAGCAMLLLTIKPHVTYLVLAVLIIWIIRNKQWRVLISLATSGFISIVIIWVIVPEWLVAYFNLLSTLPNTQIFTSTLGSFFESEFGLTIFKYVGLLLIPIAFPLSKSVDDKGWLTVLNIALIISIPLASYGFSFDHILLIPAIAQIISWIRTHELPRNYSWIIGVGLILDYLIIIYLMKIQVGLPYYWYVWPSVVLAGLYALGLVKKYENPL